MSETVASSALPPGFRRDADTAGLPAAGVALLVALAVGAAWTVWVARRRTVAAPGGQATRRATWQARFWPKPAAIGASGLRVVESAALTAGARLQVVAWGGRRYLLATSAQGVPLLIDREAGAIDRPWCPADAPEPGATST